VQSIIKQGVPLMSKYLKEAEHALAELASHEGATRKAIQAAFRQERDPLRVFSECLAQTSVIHARSVHALHRAHADEIRTFIQTLEDRAAETAQDNNRIIIFGFWVRKPEQFIKGLVYTTGVALLLILVLFRFR